MINNADSINEKYAKRITEIIKIKDESERLDKVREVVIEIDSICSEEMQYIEAKRIISIELQIDIDTKLRFFMIASRFIHDEYFRTYKLSEKFYDDCFEFITRKPSCEFKEFFIDMLENDLELQKEYALYFKYVDFRYLSKYKNSIKHLLTLPMIKEIILKDETFIYNHLGHFPRKEYFAFFSNLPNEFRYLITLYNIRNILLKELYSRLFGNDLSDESLNELIELHQKIMNSPNRLKLDIWFRIKELRFILLCISKDKRFYSNMKQIQLKAGLDFTSIVNFSYKYYGTELYNYLMNENMEYSLDIQKKLSYLAEAQKKEGLEKISDLKSITMQNLKDMPEEIEVEATSKLVGGLVSETDIHILPDSAVSEVRRINKDGTILIASYSSKIGSHYPALVDVYGDIFGGERLTQECVRIATIKFESVTWIIENETALIFVPKDLTNEQKKICVEWLNLANEGGQIGIFVYLKKRKKINPISADLFEAIEAKEIILKLGNRISENDLGKIIINDKEKWEAPDAR